MSEIKKTSKFTGVSWDYRAKKWKAAITVDGKAKYIGLFESQEEAHFAYLCKRSRVARVKGGAIEERPKNMYEPKDKNIKKLIGNQKIMDSLINENWQLKHNVGLLSRQIDDIRHEYEQQLSDLLMELSEIGVNRCKSCGKLHGIKNFQPSQKECNKCYSSRQTERRNNDPVLYVAHRMRSLVSGAFKNKGYKKNTRTHDVIGTSYKNLLKHLNQNPYGFVADDPNIDIDHIIPLSTAKTEEDVYRLNHYTNLQLLPSAYNRWVKRDNEFDRRDFEEWMKVYWDV